MTPAVGGADDDDDRDSRQEEEEEPEEQERRRRSPSHPSFWSGALSGVATRRGVKWREWREGTWRGVVTRNGVVCEITISPAAHSRISS